MRSMAHLAPQPIPHFLQNKPIMNSLSRVRMLLQQCQVYWVAPFVLLAALVVLAPVPANTIGVVRTMTLDPSQFEFAPGRLEVNQGDQVVITLKSLDVVHGFYVNR